MDVNSYGDSRGEWLAVMGEATRRESEVRATRVERHDGTWFIDRRPDLGADLADLASRAGYQLQPVTGAAVWGGIKVHGTI